MTTMDGETPRFLNFDAVTVRRVAITARAATGGRTFELRDDFPAHIMLRYQILPTVEERSKALLLALREEARATNGNAGTGGGGAEGDEPATVEAFEERLRRELRESATVRAAMARFARELDEDLLDICGEIFRFTYPALTNDELFGAWDEARMCWEGGAFAPQEARQIVELFTRLRGGESSSRPPVTERPTTSPTTSPTPNPNRAARRRSPGTRAATS